MLVKQFSKLTLFLSLLLILLTSTSCGLEITKESVVEEDDSGEISDDADDGDAGSDDDDNEEDETTPPLSVTVSIANRTIVEGTSVDVTVTLNRISESETNIGFSLSEEVSEQDVAMPTNAVIASGEIETQISLDTFNDQLFEGDENFILSYSVSNTESDFNETSGDLSLTLKDLQESPVVNLDVEKDAVGVSETLEIKVTADVSAQADYQVPLKIYYDNPFGPDITFDGEINFNNQVKGKRFLVDLSKVTVVEGSTLSVELLGGDDTVYRLGDKTTDSVNIISDASAAVTVGSPFGVAPSHASTHFSNWWFDPIRSTGIDWIRGHDGKGEDVREKLETIKTHGYHQMGILQWSAGDGFPDEDIEGWKAYVLKTVQDAEGYITQWEVWNEPPNFSDDKDPAHYAQIVKAAYEVVKDYDSTLSVGLAAKSVHVNFLEKAIVAGAKDHFDFITLHPYESARVMQEEGYDASYMAIVPSVRKMLERHNPRKKYVPIVFTEVGTPVQPGGVSVDALSPEELDQEHHRQALLAFKTYVMSLAQGVTRIHWFQPIDNENQSFGLITGNANNWQPRPALQAMQTLIKEFGDAPRYQGWIALDNYSLGFVFSAGENNYLASWRSLQSNSSTELNFSQNVTLIDPITGAETVSDQAIIDYSPVLIKGVPSEVLKAARQNISNPIPWGDNYSNLTAASLTPGNTTGLYTFNKNIVNLYGENVFDVSGHVGASFVVDPNFLNYSKTPLRISVEARFKGDINDSNIRRPGFNLRYESVDGLRNHSAGWRSVPKDDQWHEISWHVTDPQFVGMWGYHFSFSSDSTANSNYVIRKVKVEKL